MHLRSMTARTLLNWKNSVALIVRTVFVDATRTRLVAYLHKLVHLHILTFLTMAMTTLWMFSPKESASATVMTVPIDTTQRDFAESVTVLSDEPSTPTSIVPVEHYDVMESAIRIRMATAVPVSPPALTIYLSYRSQNGSV